MNSVQLIGNLTKDAEKNEKGNMVAFTVAHNRAFKTKDGNKGEEVSFFRICTYGPLAEVCQKFLTKGSQVAITGRLKQYDHIDNDTQKKGSRTVIVADTVKFLRLKGEAASEQEPELAGAVSASDAINWNE